MSSGVGTFIAVNYECDEPGVLAEFYKVLGGGEVTYQDADYAAVTLEGGQTLYFGRVPGYRRPTWPEGDVPQQAHLDFYVDDLDKAEELLVAHGAGRPEHQPGEDRWRVLTDPSGHPFCVCLRKTEES